MDSTIAPYLYLYRTVFYYLQSSIPGCRWSLQVGLRSVGPRSTAMYFLGTCYPGYRWRKEFHVPLLALLQLQSYLVPCISARIFIIPKLRNIHWRKFIGELFSLCIELENLSNCCFVRHSPLSLDNCFRNPDWSFREHLSRALPTKSIFYLLRSICLERLIGDCSTGLVLDTLEIIIKWLQVSVSNRRIPQTKNSICV